MLFELMLTEIQKKYPDVHGKLIDIKGVVFEERVKMNCFYCGKYNSNWKCPPHVPQLDWKMIMEECRNGFDEKTKQKLHEIMKAPEQREQKYQKYKDIHPVGYPDPLAVFLS